MSDRNTTSLRGTTLALWIALASAVPGRAQPPPEPASASAPGEYVDAREGLSLQEAIARGLEREPSLAAVRTAVEAAAALRRQAVLRPNPTVSFERREEFGGMDNQTMAGVQLPLELFRRGPRIAAAERSVEVSRFEAADWERLIAGAIRAQYGALLAAIRRLAVIEDVHTAAARTFDLVEARVSEGAAPRIDRDVADVDLYRVAARRTLARGDVDAAAIELKRLVGLPPEAPLKVRDTLDLLAGDGAESGPPASGLDTRPDLLAASARVALADARLEQARSEGRFDVALTAGYMRMDGGFPQRGVGPAGSLEPIQGVFHNVSGGLMVMVPIFDRRQGEIAAAASELVVAERQRDARRLEAAAAVAAARVRHDRARAALVLFSEGVRDRARRNLDVVRESYELGRVTLTALLDEQRRFLELEEAYIDTLTATFDAHTALRVALGEVVP